MRTLLAYSGGLDTSWLVAWLTRERGLEVTTLAIDCGGWDDAERDELRRRAEALGAVRHVTIDARADLFQRVVRWLIAGNVRRGGAYPLSVGAERGLQAELLARTAQELGFDSVAHGCTAAGNDQVRFEIALATLAPGLEVLAPVRDLGPSREEQVEYLRALDLPVPQGGGRYSVNAGLWGVTIGGVETHTSGTPLPEEAWHWTRNGKGQATVVVGFEEGVPASLDGAALEPVELVERLNRDAGKLGVGRGYHLGDTVLGFKGRIGFEAPAAEVLLAAHRELEKLVLTEEQRFWKDHLGDLYGKKIHQGQIHEPLMRDVEAFFASSQQRVGGEADVAFHGGQPLVQALSSPFSMMAASDARYGERPASGTDPAGAVWLARTMAEPSRLAQRAGRGRLRPTKRAAEPVPAASTNATEVTP
jgi:argininosuccinate synthase